MKYLKGTNKPGKIVGIRPKKIFSITCKAMTEKEYLDYMINESIKKENYEECARLFKIKNETP